MGRKSYIYSAILHSLVIAAAYLALIRPHSENVPVEIGEAHVDSIPQAPSTKPSGVANAGPAQGTAEHQGSGGGVSESAAILGYIQTLRQKISENQEYPKLAARDHREGLITMQIEIGEKGEIVQITSISAEKPQILVQAARAAIERSAPFPPPPAGFPRKFDVPIEFRLSK
ncbi:MAG: TonB family protein [Bdellovibrionales bacterium]|nr:TonB family protein [Bdellovibrionales bacterium]